MKGKLFLAAIFGKENKRISQCCFYGNGRAFLNYDNVILAIKSFNDSEKFAIGARSISVSTVGILDGIDKFSKEN